MERGGLAIAILVWGGGCSSFLGLDSPELAPDAGVTAADAAPDATPPVMDCITLPLRAMDDDDSDTLNDTVDNCFGQTNAQADTDNDGIGNACDPRAGTDTRHCVWTFRRPEGNEDAGVWERAWTIVGSWDVADSRLEHDESNALQPVWSREQPVESAGGIAFDTRYRLDGYTAPVLYGVALELHDTANAKTIYDCRVVQAQAANAVVHITRDGNILRTVNVPAVLPTMFTSYVRFAAIRDAGMLTIRCTVDMPALPGISAAVEEADRPVRARPGVFADRVNLAFDHVALYKLGP